MKGIDKLLRKLSSKEREIIEVLVGKIIARDIKGLDCKKLRGLRNLFRVRKGNIRIIFELKSDEEPMIISVERRSEDTYKSL
ncbi:MAG: RelE/StbE replicon stabilization toxin [Parcubacteria group bacterium GW2011_GWB1_50_9]|nr:MAG: RelE/StbE replicon stabilization toxin [Parcubacteria group bacterium GW2011_GWB1_50_9]